MLAHQFDEQFELRSVHGLRYVRPPHMVHDHRRGEGSEESIELREFRGLEVNDDVPPQRRDAPRDLEQHLARRRIDQPLHEVESYATHPGRITGADALPLTHSPLALRSASSRGKTRRAFSS